MSDSSYFQLCDCIDTKEAIEGIKDFGIVLGRTWTLSCSAYVSSSWLVQKCAWPDMNEHLFTFESGYSFFFFLLKDMTTMNKLSGQLFNATGGWLVLLYLIRMQPMIFIIVNWCQRPCQTHIKHIRDALNDSYYINYY